MKIFEGVIKRAQKVVIYGPEGIGKSTLASKFPEPIFIDTEGSTAQLDVKRFEKPSSWTMLLQQVKYAAQNPDIAKTLVIDTADWAEKLLKDHVCAVNNWSSIESPGYGKGYTVLAEEWARLFEVLNEVVKAGLNVVITAHAQMRKFEQPDEMGSYDRWELKLEKKTAPITKEWADIVLFCNFKTDVVIDSKTKKAKATGGHRVMYTSHHPAWDAKNRHGLNEELPMEYEPLKEIFEEDLKVSVPVREREDVPKEEIEQFENAIEEAKETKAEDKKQYEGIPTNLAELMFVNDVKEDEIREAVHKNGYFPLDTKIADYPEDFINGVLVGAWDQVFNLIKEIRKEKYPFDIK